MNRYLAFSINSNDRSFLSKPYLKRPELNLCASSVISSTSTNKVITFDQTTLLSKEGHISNNNWSGYKYWKAITIANWVST